MMTEKQWIEKCKKKKTFIGHPITNNKPVVKNDGDWTSPDREAWWAVNDFLIEFRSKIGNYIHVEGGWVPEVPKDK